MRHLAISLFALASILTNAQDYLGNYPVWLVHSICGIPAPCISNDDYNYYTTGDSVIDNVTWTKVVREGVASYLWQGPPPALPWCVGLHPYGPVAQPGWLIRQDGRALRIWADNTDQLLFDFDLTVGQTIPLTWNNWNDNITVVAVDSVLIGTEMRARFELGNSWSQYIIEGVGGSNGLFEPISNFFDCGYELQCFGLGEQSYYPGTWSGSCFIATGIQQLAASGSMVVAPNPAGEMIAITGVRPGEVITVLDGIGRAVIHERSLSRTMRLDVSHLPEGPYTVVQGASRQRLLVIR